MIMNADNRTLSKKELNLDDPNDRAILKTELYLVVDQIISELPESQKTFYRDLFDGNLNQANVAELYGITPQAVTNRLKKLKKTVLKKIEKEYGLDRDTVLTILGFRDFDQLINDELNHDRRYTIGV